MKLISFVVPCYNSQAYMKKCIDSLLTAGEDVEIIIVNDGSTDITLKIAKTYRVNFPSVIKVIDKPNGGHGSGINAGLKEAEGLYFKVVDSDDWLDETALAKLISTIKSHISAGQSPDMYIANFVYDKPSVNDTFVSHYRKKMPAGRIFTWDEVKKFHYSKMMLMHALFYKREKLVESGTVLPEHTFYVDNIFAYKPLPCMQTLSACLTGMGRAKKAMLATAVAVCVKFLLEVLLLRVPSLSVLGAAIAADACYLVAFSLDLFYTVKKPNAKGEYRDHRSQSGSGKGRLERAGAGGRPPSG